MFLSLAALFRYGLFADRKGSEKINLCLPYKADKEALIMWKPHFFLQKKSCR